MLRFVNVKITDNEADTAPGLFVSDSDAVGLTCDLAVNQPVESLSTMMKTLDSTTHAFDDHCSFFDNNFITVIPFSHFESISLYCMTSGR